MNGEKCRSFVVAALTALASTTTNADVITDWNEIAQQTVAKDNPLQQSRDMAITQLAVFDAVNAVAGGYEAYLDGLRALPGASADAAAIAAAHNALASLHPEAEAMLDAAMATAMAAVPDGAGKREGTALGKQAAAAIIAWRLEDGADQTWLYDEPAVPGVWRPTPPDFKPALAPHWRQVTPFAIEQTGLYTVALPPAIDSERYAMDLREIYERGGAASTSRSDEFSKAARFWIMSGVQAWNPAARQAIAEGQHGVADNARALALLNVAVADALIACWEQKYTFKAWRPLNVIQAGAAGIGPDAAWEPLIPNPPFPAYPSGHGCAAGAARAVLEALYGAIGHDITLTSPAAPGVAFDYDGFEAIAAQVDEARIQGGIHMRHDQTAGQDLGRRIGEQVLRTALAPIEG